MIPGSLHEAIKKLMPRIRLRAAIRYANIVYFWSNKYVSQGIEYLLGRIRSHYPKRINIKSEMNKNWVLWFCFMGTNGIFGRQHSMYTGSFSILCNSLFRFCSRFSLIMSTQEWFPLVLAALFEPFKSKERTGLVDLSSLTLLIAKCNGV